MRSNQRSSHDVVIRSRKVFNCGNISMLWARQNGGEKAKKEEKKDEKKKEKGDEKRGKIVRSYIFHSKSTARFICPTNI